MRTTVHRVSTGGSCVPAPPAVVTESILVAPFLVARHAVSVLLAQRVLKRRMRGTDSVRTWSFFHSFSQLCGPGTWFQTLRCQSRTWASRFQHRTWRITLSWVSIGHGLRQSASSVLHMAHSSSLHSTTIRYVSSGHGLCVSVTSVSNTAYQTPLLQYRTWPLRIRYVSTGHGVGRCPSAHLP
eukprot:2189024-Rhodomonas_salina.3